MKPTGGGKPIMRTVQQKAQHAAQAAKQGALDETQQFLRTAASQVGVDRLPMAPRAEGVGQSQPQVLPHQEFDDMAAYREQVKAKEAQRMSELKSIIEQEMAQARMKREQEQQAIAQAQVTEMQKDEQKEEEKKGLFATISRAAKRVKGRLGHVGKGKMEKGRAASG